MKLKTVRVKNYKSIQDTGLVNLGNATITTFAGQNESGKSSFLEGLSFFYTGTFDPDSVPFEFEESTQEISCTFLLDPNDNSFWHSIEKDISTTFSIPYEHPNDILDIAKLEGKIKEFTLTRQTIEDDGRKGMLIVDNTNYQIIKACVQDKKIATDNATEDTTVDQKKEKILNLTDDDLSKLAAILHSRIPKIVLFNDFCDLLPDKFTIADLKADNKAAKGYKAVKNFEKISGVNFLNLFSLDDLKRDSVEEKHNDAISIDFTKAWKQRIHVENKVKLAFKFEKRDTEENSFIVFYVETKDKQKIRPRLRSKGLIWFLSFWMELQASGSDSKLIILADEPGLYLHVRAQEDILAVFEEQVTDKGHQILYSTHSPNLINTANLERINLVINDENQGTLIEGITTSKIDSQNKQDALQPIANAIGFSVSNFTLTNKKNVLLEGISDYFYYLAMRNLLNRKSQYSFVPGIGVRKQNTLISFCIGYGLDWVAIFDDDSTRGLDSQNKYTEIKNSLFGGDESAASLKMHITNGIPSVEDMFTQDDMKNVDPNLKSSTSTSSAIGENRKVVFAKAFFEKVESKTITKSNLDDTTIKRFESVFNWIDKQLVL